MKRSFGVIGSPELSNTIQGEPWKRQKQLTRAFSEAYGDYGYTLVLEADRTYLALHHQFDSVEAAIRDGVDIIPNVTNVRVFDKPQRTADTERGAELRIRIELLERLIEAYQNNELHQSSMDSSRPAESLP